MLETQKIWVIKEANKPVLQIDSTTNTVYISRKNAYKTNEVINCVPKKLLRIRISSSVVIYRLPQSQSKSIAASFVARQFQVVYRVEN